MRRLAFALLALLALLAMPAGAWTSIEEPPSASLQWVAEEMEYNGVPTRIRFFRSKSAPAEVLAFYRERWSAGGKRRYVENKVGPWKTISHAVGDDFVTVQVRPAGGGGAEGYLAQRPVAAPPHAALGQGFGLPQGSEVVNDIRSRDGARQTRTLLAFNDQTVAANASFFQTSLRRDGWELVSEGRERNGGRQMVLRQGNDELSLAMKASGGRTAVGATLVRH